MFFLFPALFLVRLPPSPFPPWLYTVGRFQISIEFLRLRYLENLETEGLEL